MNAATPAQPAPVSPHLECTVCASGVTSPHGVTATPGQAARETFIAEAEPAPFGFTAWDELPDDLRGKWARIAQAAIAAQEPHAAPGEAASLDAAVQAAAEVLFRDYESQYSAGHLTWADFADLARKTVEAAISASAKIVAEHGWTPPQPAPELAAATVLAEVLDFLDGGIPPGDEFALQVAQWRKRGLPS